MTEDAVPGWPRAPTVSLSGDMRRPAPPISCHLSFSGLHVCGMVFRKGSVVVRYTAPCGSRRVKTLALVRAWLFQHGRGSIPQAGPVPAVSASDKLEGWARLQQENAAGRPVSAIFVRPFTAST